MPTLFDPIKIGDLELANRIIMAPLTRCRADEGRVPNALMAEYYAQRASAGLIISEATSVTPLGVGSNTLVRDGGVEGVVVRLGRNFAGVVSGDGGRITAGSAALDAQVAKAAADAGIAGLEFFTGVPGTIGGALVMNAGCYGSETKDVLVEAYALNRKGERLAFSNAEMGFSYRKAQAAADQWLIFLGGQFEGTRDEPAAVHARMAEITAHHSGQTVEAIIRDGDRDRWFTAEEAKEYGLIDEIISAASLAPGGGGTGA